MKCMTGVNVLYKYFQLTKWIDSGYRNEPQKWKVRKMNETMKTEAKTIATIQPNYKHGNTCKSMWAWNGSISSVWNIFFHSNCHELYLLCTVQSLSNRAGEKSDYMICLRMQSTCQCLHFCIFIDWNIQKCAHNN